MRKSLFVVDTSNGLGEGGVVTVKNEDVVSGQDTACADTMVFINYFFHTLNNSFCGPGQDTDVIRNTTTRKNLQDGRVCY